MLMVLSFLAVKEGVLTLGKLFTGLPSPGPSFELNNIGFYSMKCVTNVAELFLNVLSQSRHVWFSLCVAGKIYYIN